MIDIPVAERVRFYRKARGFSQAELGTRASISTEHVSAIERGLRTPAIDVLLRLARALSVPSSALLGDFATEPDLVIGRPPIREIESALIAREMASPPTEADLPALRQDIRQAWSTWETSKARFTQLGQALPALIRRLNLAEETCRAPADIENRREARKAAADLYFLLRSYFRQIGRLDLSLMVADRAVRVAEDADDPLRIAVARWELSHALLASGNFAGSEHVVFQTAEQLKAADAAGDPASIAMYGALHLVGAIAAIRGKKVAAGRRLLDEVARPRAASLGERPLWGVWFGPANIGLHVVAAEMETGNFVNAITYADRVGIGQVGSIERRARFFLDLARSYEELRDDRGVLRNLLRAEQVSPEDLYAKPLARAMVRTLQNRSRQVRASDIQQLARRMGIR